MRDKNQLNIFYTEQNILCKRMKYNVILKDDFWGRQLFVSSTECNSFQKEYTR